MPVDVGVHRGSRWQSFRMALRLAGRDARKHQGRIALILSLIALPVAAMTVIVVLLLLSQLPGCPLEE